MLDEQLRFDDEIPGYILTETQEEKGESGKKERKIKGKSERKRKGGKGYTSTKVSSGRSSCSSTPTMHGATRVSD